MLLTQVSYRYDCFLLKSLFRATYWHDGPHAFWWDLLWVTLSKYFTFSHWALTVHTMLVPTVHVQRKSRERGYYLTRYCLYFKNSSRVNSRLWLYTDKETLPGSLRLSKKGSFCLFVFQTGFNLHQKVVFIYFYKIQRIIKV